MFVCSWGRVLLMGSLKKLGQSPLSAEPFILDGCWNDSLQISPGCFPYKLFGHACQEKALAVCFAYFWTGSRAYTITRSLRSSHIRFTGQCGHQRGTNNPTELLMMYNFVAPSEII